jgi:hypothetical protein
MNRGDYGLPCFVLGGDFMIGARPFVQHQISASDAALAMAFTFEGGDESLQQTRMG